MLFRSTRLSRPWTGAALIQKTRNGVQSRFALPYPDYGVAHRVLRMLTPDGYLDSDARSPPVVDMKDMAVATSRTRPGRAECVSCMMAS